MTDAQLLEAIKKQNVVLVKSLYGMGFPIQSYVVIGMITADDYRTITDQDYVAA